MDVASAFSAPVSTALEAAPPRDSRALSSQTPPASPDSQSAVSGSSTTGPDPTARVGGQIDTYV